jgi:hypothetical protein
MTLDTLSSQGIQEAVSSALRGAVVVNTLLRRSSSAELAIQFYRSRQIESLQDHASSVARFYRSAFERRTDFWKRRAGDDGDLRVAQRAIRLSESAHISLSAETRIVETGVAEGNFIVRGVALEHPSLTGPIAFVNGLPISTLAQFLGSGTMLGSLTQARRSHEQQRLFVALNWLASRGIVVSRRNSVVSVSAER